MNNLELLPTKYIWIMNFAMTSNIIMQYRRMILSIYYDHSTANKLRRLCKLLKFQRTHRLAAPFALWSDKRIWTSGL